MPLYEYQCEACKKRFELIRKFSDPPLKKCPECGKGPVQKLVSAPGFQFKGTGWYVTDYAKSGSSVPASESAPSSESGDAAPTTETKKKDTKPAKADKKK